MTTTDLAGLIEKLESASEGSFELDYEIEKALLNSELGAINKRLPSLIFDYSRSLDAALALVPKGWHWTIEGPDPLGCVKPYCLLGLPGQKEADGRAATPALALSIAALKARSQS